MDTRELRTARLAIEVLRRSIRHFGETSQTDAVRLALRVLLPYAESRTLTTYWTVAANPNPSQRAHNLRRVLSLIEASAGRHGIQVHDPTWRN